MEIPANETDVIRLFAINRPPADLRSELSTLPVADLARKLLQSPHLDTASAEIFPVSDLAGVGLGAYLTEGYAVEAEAVGADRARLDALDGFVMLLFSDSFAGAGTTLTPGPEVTLVGTYTEFRPKSDGTRIRAKGAAAYSGTPSKAPPTPRPTRVGSIIVLLAIVIASGLGLWWMLT